jgi:MoxR-like ATPase
MAWEPVVTITHRDIVQTPHGQGQVVRISESQGTAQVQVGSQLFEVPVEEITKVEQPGAPSGTPEGAEGDKMFKVGDRVENKISNAKGEVTDVTQRSVKVSYDNGNRQVLPKRGAFRDIKKIPKEGTPNESPKQQPENKQEDKQEQKSAPEDIIKTTGDGLEDLFKLKQYLENKIETSVDGELSELREIAKKTQKLEITQNGKTVVLEGLKHKQLDQLITYASMRLSPLLVGMAGTGKTHAGEQTAVALGLQFYAMSVGAQTSKSDIIGYMDASGNYVRTHFRDAFEHGGVFLMDEIDAGNSNVLIQINSALSNGLCAFPDAMVKRHEDFVFIASANTFGNGANRQYVGRNQLDAATLDRFALIEWLIDDELESNLAVGVNGKAWYMAVRATRDYVSEKNIRALISPRATQKGSRLLDVGQDLLEVIGATLLGSVPEDKKADVTQVTTSVFNKFASEVKSQLSKAVNPEVSELIRNDVPF